MSGFDVVAAGYFLRSIPYPDVRSVTIETGTRNRTQFMDGSKPEGIAFRAHTLKSDRPSKRASGKSRTSFTRSRGEKLLASFPC